MRFIITLLLSILSIVSNAKTTYQKLCEVNKVWKEQDISANELPVYANYTEQQWIQLHLSLVEQTLRSKNTDQLTRQQQRNRSKALDYLHSYWQIGSFPQNEDYSYRTPIFIDRHDNFCAVGYLVKATGNEHISRKISANTNLAYVRDMRYEELFTWANEYGFTVDELAWIQPTYAPPVYALPVGTGFSGRVSELYVDPAGQNLYVGGTFINNSSPEFCNNIARVTNDGGFEWHNMGAGVNGRVDAIAQFVNDIFVAGSFNMAGNVPVSNIAKWNGFDWQPAGCIHDSVKDMVVYNGKLYACGNFTICADPTPVNFAVWTGAIWQSIPGIFGTVNTMEVVNNDLFLGGNFNYLSLQVNAVKWNEGSGFSLFGNPIQNEVNDFVTSQGYLFAYCKQTSTLDSGLIHALMPDQSWLTTFKSNLGVGTSFNAGCEYIIGRYNSGKAILGGSFNSTSPCLLKNSAMVRGGQYLCSFNVDALQLDSTVNKVIMFKGHVILGGDFSAGICRQIGYHHVMLKTDYTLNSCDGRSGNVSAYVPGGNTSLSPQLGFPPYKYLWSTGDTAASVNNLSSGSYTVVVTDSLGDKDTVIVTIGPVDFNVLILDSLSGTLLTQNTGDSIKWIDCNTGAIVYRSSGWSGYEPLYTGSYASIVTLHGCTDTTNCVYVEVLPNAINTSQTQRAAILYPNPVDNMLNIDFQDGKQVASIKLCDLSGKVLVYHQGTIIVHTQMDLSTLAAGIYSVTISYADGSTNMHKLIKQ